MDLINWELLKHPYNWIIVVLMCLFALALLTMIFPQSRSGISADDKTGA